MSTTFNYRDREGSNRVLGDATNYKHTLVIGSKLSTARNRTSEIDSYRVTISDRMLDTASICANEECGLPRTDRAMFDFSIALGQPAAYYARKKEQILTIQTALAALYTSFDETVSIGSLPSALRGETFTTVTPS